MSFDAEKCIDSITTKVRSNLCHTDDNANNAPWLALKFPEPVKVARVDIYNRGDYLGYYSRLRNVEVRVTDELPRSGDQMYTGGHILGTFAGPGTKGQIIKVEGPARTGRYVLIQMNNPDSLNLHEVEAFGTVVSPGNGNDFHLSRTTQ